MPDARSTMPGVRCAMLGAPHINLKMNLLNLMNLKLEFALGFELKRELASITVHPTSRIENVLI